MIEVEDIEVGDNSIIVGIQRDVIDVGHEVVMLSASTAVTVEFAMSQAEARALAAALIKAADMDKPEHWDAA